MQKKRIVITGMGVISSIGHSVDEYWKNLVAGVSGGGRLQQFDPGDMPYSAGYEVKGFDPLDHMDRNVLEYSSRATQFAIAASRQAITDSGLSIDSSNAERIGVMVASGGGGIPEYERAAISMFRNGWRAVPDYTMSVVMANSIACTVAIEVGARGPAVTHTAACASGHYSMLEGYHALQRGEADAIIAGGTESLNSPLVMSAFGRMGALSSRIDEPKSATRPFSIDRDGFLPGEGACVVVMETEEHAMRRHAPVFGEVLGGCLTADAFHVTAPDPDADGAARAITGALRNAGLAPEDIDIVLAHGTATRLNDAGEGRALIKSFGAHVCNLQITSIKSMIGHGLGAAGAQSAIAAVKSLQQGIVPPTINYVPDPEIDVPIVGNVPQQIEAQHAIVNAFGFGGQNVVVVFRRARVAD